MRTHLRRKYMHQLDTCGGLVGELTSIFFIRARTLYIYLATEVMVVPQLLHSARVCSRKDNIVLMY